MQKPRPATTELRLRPLVIRAPAVVVAAALWAPAAAAVPTVTVPPECGSASSFDVELRRRVGPRTDAILRETRLSIFRDGEQYRLFMQVGDETREFRDPNCQHLFSAAIVVAASLAEGPAQPPAPPTDVTARPAPLAPAGEAPDDAARRPPRGPVLGAAVAIGTNFGFLPHPSLGVELVGSAEWHAWGVALRARYFAPSEEDTAGRGVDVQTVGAEVAGTFVAWQVLEIRAGMNVRLAIGTGHGSPSTSTDTAWAFAPVAGLRAFALQFGDTWVGAGADVALNLSPPRFEILQYGEVFRSSRVDGSVFLGAGHRFR